MEKKFNIEDLKKQCAEAEENFNKLHNELLKAEREEKEQKEKKLAAEKDKRYKEVIAAYENFAELRDKYTEDYGVFSYCTSNFNPKIRDLFLF